VIWQLVKRDPAWQMMLYVAAGSVVVRGFGSSDPSQALATVLGFIAITMCISVRGFRQRYTMLQATLPIEGKQLFLARILSLLAFIWVPIVSASAAMSVAGNWTWQSQMSLLEYLAVATLGILLVQCVRVQTIDPPAWLTIVVFGVVVISVPMAGQLQKPVVLIIALIAGCVLASVALFVKAWREVPKSFQLAPTDFQREPFYARFQRSGPSMQAIHWWPVFRSVYFGDWRTGIWASGMLFVLIQCAIFGSGFALFALIYIPMSSSGYRRGLRWLVHLPIPARKLMWVVWAPTTAAAVIGLAFNAADINGLLVPQKTAVMLGPSQAWGRTPFGGADADPRETFNVQVPAAFWRWARGGTVPVTEAPWGERYQPRTSARWGFAFYNPYSVGRENSQRFLEWQFLRATEAVYGRAIPVSQSRDLARMKPILQQPKAQAIVAAIALLYFLLQMCALHLSGWWRVRYARGGFRASLAMAPMFAAFLFILAPFPDFAGGYFFNTLLLRLSRILPDSLWMLALMTATIMAGLYWLAEKLWRENEFSQIQIEMRTLQAQAVP
jgi:hypothetical protein